MTSVSELDLDNQLLESFQRGEWQSVGNPNRLMQLHSDAKATLAKDKRIAETPTVNRATLGKVLDG